MAERPSDRAIAQAFFEIAHCALSAKILILKRAREIDAAPSEPSAEHWRGAIADIFGPDMPATVERRAIERAREGK